MSIKECKSRNLNEKHCLNRVFALNCISIILKIRLRIK